MEGTHGMNIIQTTTFGKGWLVGGRMVWTRQSDSLRLPESYSRRKDKQKRTKRTVGWSYGKRPRLVESLLGRPRHYSNTLTSWACKWWFDPNRNQWLRNLERERDNISEDHSSVDVETTHDPGLYVIGRIQRHKTNAIPTLHQRLSGGQPYDWQ